MITGAIDYSSDIGAKQENIDAINKQSSLSYALQDNNGYGYIGINPKYVQDIEVRRLIMYAIDRQYITDNYYTNGLGSIIERPMTTNSWAYPEDATTYYTQDWFIDHYKTTYNKTLTATDDTEQFVENALKALGYTMQGGVYQRTLADGKTVSKLEYTFTIAGETKDHPAYGVFQDVATRLDGIIKITVKTDALALSKLSNGQLAVWAAAWGSAIDPDMYQVYHKYSQATSVNNWGYSTILSDSTKLYETERTIIDTLSKLIDRGRSMLDQDMRADVYADALDVVMELAVELPTYQRSNLLVYNNTKIDPASLTPTSELTAYRGLIDKIWELDLL
jgi:peptide/nickel transport system substrate-binding protein